MCQPESSIQEIMDEEISYAFQEEIKLSNDPQFFQTNNFDNYFGNQFHYYHFQEVKQYQNDLNQNQIEIQDQQTLYLEQIQYYQQKHNNQYKQNSQQQQKLNQINSDTQASIQQLQGNNNYTQYYDYSDLQVNGQLEDSFPRNECLSQNNEDIFQPVENMINQNHIQNNNNNYNNPIQNNTADEDIFFGNNCQNYHYNNVQVQEYKDKQIEKEQMEIQRENENVLYEQQQYINFELQQYQYQNHFQYSQSERHSYSNNSQQQNPQNQSQSQSQIQQQQQEHNQNIDIETDISLQENTPQNSLKQFQVRKKERTIGMALFAVRMHHLFSNGYEKSEELIIPYTPEEISKIFYFCEFKDILAYRQHLISWYSKNIKNKPCVNGKNCRKTLYNVILSPTIKEYITQIKKGKKLNFFESFKTSEDYMYIPIGVLKKYIEKKSKNIDPKKLTKEMLKMSIEDALVGLI